MPFIEIKGRRIDTTPHQDALFTECVGRLRRSGIPGDEARLRCAIQLGLYAEPTPEAREVTLPRSAQKALHSLVDEPSLREWGGGIDFEVVEGKAQVERILSYFGETAKVPWRVIQKYDEDLEVTFHTHPPQARAMPSKGDIGYFINSRQQVSLIVAEDEILILEKTPNTPLSITEAEIETRSPDLGYYEPHLADMRAQQVASTYGIKTTLVPRETRISFDLDVIRGLKTS